VTVRVALAELVMVRVELTRFVMVRVQTSSIAAVITVYELLPMAGLCTLAAMQANKKLPFVVVGVS